MFNLHPMQESYFLTLKESNPDLVSGRVIFSSHDSYRIIFANNEERLAKVRGSFYHQGDELPVVGDWVALEILQGDHEFLLINALLPRTSSLKRFDTQRGSQTLVANIDFIGLVTSFNRDLNERRLERGLAMIEEGKSTPLIILNKQDLIEPQVAADYIEELSQRFPHVQIISCAAKVGSGVEKIRSYFKPGQSVAFLGMSGVGKSTLINALLESEKLDTGGIREDDARGRHTTTHREMFLTDSGFWVVDNPGIREFSFSGEDSSLDSAFEDVVALTAKCKFGNCSHEVEPGCKIKAALASGELDEDRWANYLKMKGELAYHAAKYDKRLQIEKKKQTAKANKDLKIVLKKKGRK